MRIRGAVSCAVSAVSYTVGALPCKAAALAAADSALSHADSVSRAVASALHPHWGGTAPSTHVTKGAVSSIHVAKSAVALDGADLGEGKYTSDVDTTSRKDGMLSAGHDGQAGACALCAEAASAALAKGASAPGATAPGAATQAAGARAGSSARGFCRTGTACRPLVACRQRQCGLQRAGGACPHKLPDFSQIRRDHPFTVGVAAAREPHAAPP